MANPAQHGWRDGPGKTKATDQPGQDSCSSSGYVVEHQENLRALQVLVYGVARPAADLILEVVSPNEAALTSKSDPSQRVPIVLPAAALPNQSVSLTASHGGYFEARLAALPTLTVPLGINTPLTHALSAPELRAIAPRSLRCVNCDREVAALPDNVTFKDLPSEHWAEMLEVWMCHQDPGFTATLAKHKDGFWPNAETVQVGGSYILVNGKDVVDTHLQLDRSADPQDAWQILTCPCGEVLGKVRQNDGRPGAGTVRFSKWAISLLGGKGDSQVQTATVPMSAFVVSDMLELAQAHASHRFVITDEATGDRRLAVWMFNPSVRVSFRRPAELGSPTALAPPVSAQHGVARSMRTAKILYHVVDSPSPESPIDLPGFTGFSDDPFQAAAANGKPQQSQVETLAYSRDVCEGLVIALRQSTSCLPAPRRAMGSFEVGWLERV